MSKCVPETFANITCCCKSWRDLGHPEEAKMKRYYTTNMFPESINFKDSLMNVVLTPKTIAFNETSIRLDILEQICKHFHFYISRRKGQKYQARMRNLFTLADDLFDKSHSTHNARTREMYQYNTLSVSNDLSLSSRNSFFYNFLYGSTGDLGLKRAGFKITQTKTEEKTITVTTWEPIVKMAKGTQKIILAHENNLPIFMSFIDEKKLTFLKIYYDNYQKLNNLFLPTLMTEIEYTSKKDSVITRRNFADFKTNETCDKTYFNFVIPSSAKLIQTGSK
jgi:outer membrane lipoprotein-sorting protein